MARSRTPVWARSVALALVLLPACTADVSTPGGEQPPPAGASTPSEDAPAHVGDGQVVVGLSREPAVLNPALDEGNLFATSKIVLPVLYPLWRITPDLGYEPLLLAEEPKTRGGEAGAAEPFTVTYTIREEAVWSDGTPVTAGDVVFTLETCLDGRWEVTSRVGCEEVTATNIIDDKTVELVFRRPYAPWRTLFAGPEGVVLPAHALRGKNFDDVWDDEIVDPRTGGPIASGPFMFERWRKGGDVTLVRNERFWGRDPDVERLVFRPLEDVNRLLEAFRDGDVEVMDPRPQLGLLERIDGEGRHDVRPGQRWAHLAFQTDVPPLDELFVRRAIAMGVDRAALVDTLVVPRDPEAEPLGNVFYLRQQKAYRDNWSDAIGHDPAAAIALLEGNGCTRGPEGYFECDGRRLELTLTTTAGNELRERTFQLLRAQLRAIGVALTADFREPAAAFDKLVKRDYEMFLFAWIGGPDPHNGDSIWLCRETAGDRSRNYTGYCNPEVDRLLLEQLRTVDPTERAVLYNRADALIAQDVPVVPLYQKPTFQAWADHIVGPAVHSAWGSTWNVEQWRERG